MSEITKLYENAGVLKECLSPCYINKTWRKTHDCPNCDNRENYPPFTAEKQLELIKYFSNNYNISINKDNNTFRLLFINKNGIHNFYISGVDFAEQLALFVTSRYKNQILTEEERKQIKEILE